MREAIHVVVLLLVATAPHSRADTEPAAAELFARDNFVAWCIVPFDAKQRTPEDRAAMLARIGISHFAYDWRDVHLPTFEREIEALAKHDIALTAVWFPASLDANAKHILGVLKKHRLTPQLWISAGADSVDAGAAVIRPIAQAAAGIGCTVGLYNHGGWFGEPENQLAVIDRLGMPNVGIIYNLHHGHDHLDRFETMLAQMKPRLLCLNLNGMTRGGDKTGKKILPIGQGDLDLHLLKLIRDSGYRGRIGILNHTDEDAEARLLDNIEGLQWLVAQLDGEQAPPRPALRTWRAAATDYWSVEDAAARAALPEYEITPAATLAELTPPDGFAPSGWTRSHGNDFNTRYAPLQQINRDNVKSLEVAWTYRSGDGAANVQCNPIIVDGVLYGPTAGDHIVALDATSGHEIWRFKPPRNGPGRPAHRGLTYHAEPSPRLLLACGDRLWALDPKLGVPISSFGVEGSIAITDCVTAPVVWQDLLIYAGWNRDVFGVDVATGRHRWRFHTIPQPGEPFAETWDQPTQGANCWGGIALDSKRGLVYVTTGSPKPNFIGVGHHGDNLFANCVIALDAATGRRRWHFQEVRHDIWDLDIPAPPVLVTVNATRGGKTLAVDAVAAVTKIGNTLLLDRVSGKPLFPFRRKRTTTSSLPGERTSAYQPDVELPEPFSRQAFTLDDVTNISPAARRSVLSQIEQTRATFGWFRPFDDGRPNIYFGLHGGAEWTGAAFDPERGLLFVSSNHVPWMPSVHRAPASSMDEASLPPTPGRIVYEKSCMACHGVNREGKLLNPSLHGLAESRTEADVLAVIRTGRGAMPASEYLTAEEKSALLDYLFDRDGRASTPVPRPQRPVYRDNLYPRLLDHENYPGSKPPWGLLSAIDLATGKIAWRAPLGEHEALTRRGVPKTGTENFGGPLVTAGGLVFCAGTRDLKIRAFDQRSGEELWAAPLPFGGFAPPATYEVNGKQYIVIAATGGGKLGVPPHPGPAPTAGDTYVAFAFP